MKVAVVLLFLATFAAQAQDNAIDPLLAQQRLAAVLREATIDYDRGNFQGALARLDKLGGAAANDLSVLNLRAGFDFGSLRVNAFANNVTDKKYIAEAIPAIEFGGSFISPGARRLAGVEVGYSF